MPRKAGDMARRMVRWVLCVAMALGFVQCRRVDNQVITRDVDIRAWEERVELEFDHGRQSTQCDMDIVLHVNRAFEQREVAFEITLFTPDSLSYSERVISEVDVEWGNAARYNTDVAIEYRRDIRLDREGVYRVAIRPLQTMAGVESAGINLRMK